MLLSFSVHERPSYTYLSQTLALEKRLKERLGADIHKNWCQTWQSQYSPVAEFDVTHSHEITIFTLQQILLVASSGLQTQGHYFMVSHNTVYIITCEFNNAGMKANSSKIAQHIKCPTRGEGRLDKAIQTWTKWIKINSTTKIKPVSHMNLSGVLLMEFCAHHGLSIIPCLSISWDIRSITV